MFLWSFEYPADFTYRLVVVSRSMPNKFCVQDLAVQKFSFILSCIFTLRIHLRKTDSIKFVIQVEIMTHPKNN